MLRVLNSLLSQTHPTLLQSIGLAASHVLAGKIALNNMTENATCQLVFSIVTMVISVMVCPSAINVGLLLILRRTLALAPATLRQIVSPADPVTSEVTLTLTTNQDHHLNYQCHLHHRREFYHCCRYRCSARRSLDQERQADRLVCLQPGRYAFRRREFRIEEYIYGTLANRITLLDADRCFDQHLLHVRRRNGLFHVCL